MQLIRRFVLRLRREPAFAAIFVVTLALGVGANAALFSALRGYFLAPLPYPEANRLITVNQAIRGAQQVSAATYEYLRHNADGIVSGGLSYEGDGILKVGSASAQKVRLDAVTASWFDTMGVKPFLGRTFGANVGKPGGPKEVVLSYRFWQNAMHGDPHVVGETIMLDAAPHTVVGVMPRGFFFPSRSVQSWVPITAEKLASTQVFDMVGWQFVARLRRGVNEAAARRELNALAQRQLAEAPPDAQAYAKKHHYHIATAPLRAALIGPIGSRLLLIELGAALLLVLTAAILANLVTVRTLARRHEAALRIALGAGRLALWRTALADTLPLGLLGGACAVGLAWWGTILIARYGIGTEGTAFSIAPDGWAIGFSLLLGCAVGAVASLPAAFVSRRRLLERLAEGGRGGIGRQARNLQRTLSVLQIALGVALMVNAVLLGLAFKSVSAHPIGVNPAHLVIGDVGFHGPKFEDQSSQLTFYRRFGDAIRTLPGVQSAGVASELPFAGGLDGYGVDSVGGIETGSIDTVIEFVDGHALGALETPLVHGRLIDSADVRAKANVAVIDTSLAEKLFGTDDVVGREVKHNETYRVIGVIRPLRWRAHPQGSHGGTLWLPYSVAPADPNYYAGPDMNVAVRSTLPVETVKRELVATLHRLAPEQGFSHIESMRELKDRAYHGDQALPVLFGLFSLLALVLAAVGTYGTVAYLIRLRLGEFAVRQVLGATPARVGAIALAQGATLAAVGIALGIGAGFLLGHTLSGLIAAVGSASVVACLFAAFVMALAVLAATAIPARRARRLDLVSLLRPQ